MKNKAFLILEDGTKFAGYSFGSVEPVSGEVVFATNMAGFQETLSNPDYRGRIVVQTFPIVGASGTNGMDSESKYNAAGYVVREHCPEPSNHRNEETIEQYMCSRGIGGLYGIDTRQLTRTIRGKNGIRGIISADENVVVPSAESTAVIAEPYPVVDCEGAKYNITLVDCGVKNSFLELLHNYGCAINTVPESDCDACIVAGGVGNPTESAEALEALQAVVKSGKPVLAVGTAHQLLTVALGGTLQRLNSAHNGCNQPVRDCRNGLLYLTKQSHGCAIKDLPQSCEVILENVVDKSIEGIKYTSIPVMSLQFEPSANGGPRNTKYLLEEFLDMIPCRC